MADYDSQLPVRSKQDVDERVLTKIQDGDNPDGANETMTVSEKKAHVRMHGKDAGGVDRETLHSEEGHVQSNGDYDAVSNTRPSSQGLIASDRAVAPDETTMNKRPTAVAGDDNKVAIDCAISDSSGNRIDENNPLAVFFSDNPGQEIESFEDSGDIAKDASDQHDYAVSVGKELRKLNVECSASGKAKFELQIETGIGTGTFQTIGVKFNSTASPNVRFELSAPKPVAAEVKVRVNKTNLDNQPMSMYSTINGVEV